MPVKRAKTLSNQDLERIFAHVAISSRQPFRDALLVSFTAYAGLRIQEACSVHKRDFTDARGNIADTLFVSGRGAKHGKSRSVPIIPELKAAIVRYLASLDADRMRAIGEGAIIANIWGKALSAEAASKQVGLIYKTAGLIGCSSHSGRRTFGTRMARQLALQGGTILDLCNLLGHANVQTTLDYIDPSPHLTAIVNAIYNSDITPMPSAATGRQESRHEFGSDTELRRERFVWSTTDLLAHN